MRRSPCCDEPMVPVDATNIDECPNCHRWYLDTSILFEGSLQEPRIVEII